MSVTERDLEQARRLVVGYREATDGSRDLGVEEHRLIDAIFGALMKARREERKK